MCDNIKTKNVQCAASKPAMLQRVKRWMQQQTKGSQSRPTASENTKDCSTQIDFTLISPPAQNGVAWHSASFHSQLLIFFVHDADVAAIV